MATNKRRTSKPKEVTREQLEDLIYRHDGLTRFTQDSPVLPDVWFEFGKNPNSRIDLLLNPHFEASPGRVAQVIEHRLADEQKSKTASKFKCNDQRGSDIAYNQSTVVVRICFHELVRVVLPLTPWWSKYVWTDGGQDLQQFLSNKKTRLVLARAIEGDMSDPMMRVIDPQVVWMMRVIGTIGARAMSSTRKITPTAIVDACANLVRGINPATAEGLGIVWSVTRNRTAEAAIWKSTMAVKADAARRLFEVSCNHLTWAIIDSGIDATHPAFRIRNSKGEPDKDKFKTRVTATYDFTLIRYLLRSQQTPEDEAELAKRPRSAKAVKRMQKDPALAKQLRQSLQSGREIDWELLKPLIEVPHNDDYVVPKHSHGTHVAGIVAADWRSNDPEPSGDYMISGVCPDMKLYDLRVLDDQGQGDEFSCIAAMQFVRYLNAHKDLMMIHGVNLSLSIKHDVANFACGSTPVCEEANRLVAS
jgi:serine protease AprX